MPIYEYQCPQCGHVQQVLERMGATDQHPCPGCGAADTHKLISGFAVGRDAGSAGPASACGSGGACEGGACPFAS